MKPILVALLAALCLTTARAAHASPGGDRVVSSIVISAALGEKDRLAQIDAILGKLRPGVTLVPLEHAALWSFQMRWNGNDLLVMGADDPLDADKIRELVASTKAPSPAYRKILASSARVLVQAMIVEAIADTAEKLSSAVAAECAAVQQQSRTVAAMRNATHALDERLKAKVEGLNVIMAAMKEPSNSSDRRERLGRELAAGAEEAKALAAELETSRTQMLHAAESLQAASAHLEASMHSVPLGPAQRELVARNDLELHRLRAIAERLDAKPQLRPDEVHVFPSGLR